MSNAPLSSNRALGMCPCFTPILPWYNNGMLKAMKSQSKSCRLYKVLHGSLNSYLLLNSHTFTHVGKIGNDFHSIALYSWLLVCLHL